MNIDLAKVLKRLDTTCYVMAIAGAVPLILFEFLAQIVLFQISVFIFILTFLLLITLIVLRFVQDKKVEKGDEMSLSRGAKIRYSIFLVFCAALLMWFIYIFIKM